MTSLRRSPILAVLALVMALVASSVTPAGATSDSFTERENSTSVDALAPSWGGASDGDGRVAGLQAADADFTLTACPWITDSVFRLYTAYFLRLPDQEGFEYWLTNYSGADWSLPRISSFFSGSTEFQDMYGALDDGQFIDLVYRNVLNRQPDADGHAYWLGKMVDGLDRGTVMLFFSESAEFVGQTGTENPLAGHFSWYPEGTTWGCGFGQVTAPLPTGNTWVDVGFWNFSDRVATAKIDELVSGVWTPSGATEVQPSTFRWFVSVERPAEITEIYLESNNDVAWTLVMSPTETPSDRGGWGE